MNITANEAQINNFVTSYDNVALGLCPGRISVNKFGHAPNGLQQTLTDIWDRANATPTQQVWLAPTLARVHAVVSTSTDDDGSPAGTGARTIRIYGLKSWASEETYEDIVLNGTGAVNTTNAYVIIHRMKVLTSGASGPNVGTITATAATDATVTAAILPGDGQTEMAIYGVPSGKKALIKRWGASINTTTAAVSADMSLWVNEAPNVSTTLFLRKHDIALQSSGISAFDKNFDIPMVFAGPCIIKLRGTSSLADVDCFASFDLVVVDV